MMKRFLLVIICLLFFSLSYSITPFESQNLTLKTSNSEVLLSNNYQQFKHQIVNFETTDLTDYANLKKRRRKKQDNLMLYVAGGLAVATGVLILTNNPENFANNSASDVNMGIAIGGTLACGMFLAKYFIDKSR